MHSKVLLVEDEENLLDIIKLNLEMEELDVTTCKDGKSAVESFKPGKFNLVILDVMLPLMNGFDVCEKIRKIDKNVPVLFLTAKNESQDRVKGLKLGGDDYLAKPFNLEELLLRVNNLIKRSSKNITSEKLQYYKFGNNSVNFSTYEVMGIKGTKITLTKREVLLLKLLIEKKNEVVSREEILEEIWGSDVYPSTRTIDNYILAFRKYFEENPKEALYFHSIRGVGYKFSD